MEKRRAESEDAPAKLQNDRLKSELRYWLDDKRLRQAMRRGLRNISRADRKAEKWSGTHADKPDRIAKTSTVFETSQFERDNFRELLRGRIDDTIKEWHLEEGLDKNTKAGLAYGVLANIISEETSSNAKAHLKPIAMGLLKKAAEGV